MDCCLRGGMGWIWVLCILFKLEFGVLSGGPGRGRTEGLPAFLFDRVYIFGTPGVRSVYDDQKLAMFHHANSIMPLTLSVGSVAGRLSPAFLVRVVVSINSGVNRLLGLGVSEGAACSGTALEEGSAAAELVVGFSLLLLVVVSTGSGAKRRLGAKSFLSTPSFCFSAGDDLDWESSSFLELRVVVSTGSGANRRIFLTVVSTGVGGKRLARGGGAAASAIVLQRNWRSSGVCYSELFNDLGNHSRQSRSLVVKYGVLMCWRRSSSACNAMQWWSGLVLGEV